MPVWKNAWMHASGRTFRFHGTTFEKHWFTVLAFGNVVSTSQHVTEPVPFSCSLVVVGLCANTITNARAL